jgi:nucleoside-diphosphate-sugar epimerase
MHRPTIVIINGANWIGSKLVELMLEQKANIIIVDDFDAHNMPFIKRFSKDKHFVFVEKDKIATIRENFDHIKYFIHLKHDFDTSDDKISSKYFVGETKFVDEVLSIALEKNSHYVLTSSIHLHKDFLLKKNYSREDSKNAYTESDLQDYIEKTVLEYVTKAGLNGRIVRLGNVYGPEMDLDKDPVLKQILSDAFYRDDIRIYGDGLEYMYYVFITDAIQGIIKALFVEETHGNIYSITNPDEVSILTIVNKVLALQPKANCIKFLREKNSIDPLYEKAYIPEENLSQIGWKPKVSFDRGISQVFDYFKKDISLDNSEINAKEEEIEFNRNSIRNTNTDISVDFDDTINLANTVLEPKASPDQFNVFYQKLNDGNSPIYNPNKSKGFTKKVSIYESSPKEPKTLRDYIKYGIWFVCFCILYIFFIVPIVRLGIFFWHIKSNTAEITAVINKTKTEAPIAGLAKEAESNLSAISWAIDLTNQDKLENNILNLSKGVESASRALNIINTGNLNKYIGKKDSIPENDLSRIRDVLIILDSAKFQLKEGSELNLPFGASANIVQIRNWVDKTEGEFSKVMSQ